MAFQSIVGARLIQSALTTSYVSIYTAPTGSRVYVKDLDFCNTSGSPIGVYIHLVPANTSPTAANALFYNAIVPAYTTVQWTGSQILNAGDTIQVKATAAGGTVSITGGIAT